MPEQVHAQPEGRLVSGLPSTTFKEIQNKPLTSDDLYWLEQAMEVVHTGGNLFDLCQMIILHKAKLFRISGNAQGIVIAYIVEHRAGKELFIQALAGENILPEFFGMYKFLAERAKAYGCIWITGEFLSASHARIVSKTVKPMREATRLTFEIDHILKEI